MDDDKAAHETVKLKCGHHMCNRCLKRNFTLSLTDPQHMPPRCCTADHIPLEHVERLFDGDFKRRWNRKFAEYSTRNRLYCPTPHCGEWIRPENIRRDAGFHHGKCSRCKTKVCCACNGRWHYPRACPRDVETDRFLEQARQEGWQRCHRCNAVVELKEGCNHMTCRCGGEFCMACGSKWKSCDCPWFSDGLDNEPDDYMDVAMDPRPNPFAIPRGFDAPRRFEAPSSPRDFRSDTGPPPLTGSVRPRPSSYEEEMMLHRLQKRRDAQKPAPRQRAFTEYDAPDRDDGRGRERIHRANDPRAIDPPRYTPSQSRRPGDEYRRRPATVIVPPPSPSPDRRRSHTPARSRAQTPDRRRAHSPDQRRDTSMERRLAGRFNSDTRQNSPVMMGGALAPVGPVGHLAPMMMMAPPPPPPSYAPTQHTMGPPMPMAPVPPPAATPIMRRHMMEEEVYASPAPHRGAPRSSERHIASGSGLTRFYEQQEAAANAFNMGGGSPHAPHVRRRPPQATRVHGHELPRPSILAGLGGPGRGLNRVSEWRNYVEPGIPEGEQPPSIVAHPVRP
ncbi:hypothetical protein QBC34DRAFT_471239 [Podospora aff. communis PSN243]|uniref:IBR domain-containing protein n=1 Tax=Podospora aff. communis PSN243 TaxID=3040156 RepID=A0AAV9H2C1_9PEZI|nr:hypothetical protein QBC34DRAFT_471239 [Podospora aff. communis PSN243]